MMIACLGIHASITSCKWRDRTYSLVTTSILTVWTSAFTMHNVFSALMMTEYDTCACVVSRHAIMVDALWGGGGNINYVGHPYSMIQPVKYSVHDTRWVRHVKFFQIIINTWMWDLFLTGFYPWVPTRVNTQINFTLRTRVYIYIYITIYFLYYYHGSSKNGNIY